MGLSIAMIVRLFSLRACRSLQDVKREKKGPLELHKSAGRENRRDEDVLSCVVQFIVLTSPFSQCCFYLLASSHGSETVEKWCHGVLHGPSLQPADGPVDELNQPETCYRETGCASKKCWYTDSSSPPAISTLPYARHPRAHYTEISYKRRYWSGKGGCVLLHDQYVKSCCALTSKE